MAEASGPKPEVKAKLTVGRTLAYSAGELAATYLPMVITSWLMYFYCPVPEPGKVVAPLMNLGAFALVQFLGKISDSVSNPLVGFFSDRTKSRWGRRIPYIIFGTPIMAITSALIWFPLTNTPSMANNIYLAINLILFWGSYTAVVAPYLALMPEIARTNEERITVGAYMAGADVVGFLLGGGVVGILVGVLAKGASLGPLHFGDSFKLIGTVSALLVLLLFYLTWWFIQETPDSESKEVPMTFFEAAIATLKNPAFAYYLITVTLLSAVRDTAFGLIAYFAKNILLMGKDSEMWAGFFQMGILLGAGLSLPLITWAANKYGKKKIFFWGVFTFALVMPIAIIQPFLHLTTSANKFFSLFAFMLMGPGAASMLALWRPIISDIIDLDEKRTGYRREAMYMGMEGLITKLGAGLAPILIAVNFSLFNTEKFAAGVLTAFAMNAALVVITCLIFRFYPIEK